MTGRLFDLAAVVAAVVLLAATAELVVRRRLARARPPRLILVAAGLLTLAAVIGAVFPPLPVRNALPGGGYAPVPPARGGQPGAAGGAALSPTTRASAER